MSANPTSSLHVGHGRGAAYGMTVATLLEAAGFQVQREYYVNDAGRQMAILATSTFLRYVDRTVHWRELQVPVQRLSRRLHARHRPNRVDASHGAALGQSPPPTSFADVPKPMK